MKRFLMILLAGILLLGACDTATGIEISNAWARPAMQAGNGAVYFLLENHSAGADEIIGASSNIADVVEIHQSKMEGDVMQMQQVMSVPIAGKASVEFAPGGLHIMLIGLKQELKIGDEFQVTFQFTDHEDITVAIPVQELQDDNSMSDH